MCMVTVKTFGSARDLEVYMNEHRIGWTERDLVCEFQLTHSMVYRLPAELGIEHNYTLVHR